MHTKRSSVKPVRAEFSAGGIVFRRTPHGPQLAFVLDSARKWTFPKGHLRKGEGIVTAAVRESSEEMGLKQLRPIRKIGKIEIWFIDRYIHKGALIHKYISYVLIEAPVGARLKTPPPPRRGEPIYKAQWVALGEALTHSSYKDLTPIIKRALRIIRARTSRV